jgi:nanoRNase/pAp phosphatase (c-di-AMP/oligoRNAs hydrolase)
MTSTLPFRLDTVQEYQFLKKPLNIDHHVNVDVIASTTKANAAGLAAASCATIVEIW